VISMLSKVLKLVYRLMRESRVPVREKLVFLALLAYLLFPFDFVPDVFPLAGQVDDLLLLLVGVRRLLSAAGTNVIAECWQGSTRELNRLRKLLDALLFFLPAGIKGQGWAENRDRDVIDVEYRIEE